MIGFETRHSRYYIDGKKRTISGGIFGANEMPFKDIKCIQGLPGVIRLEDGREFITSIVKGLLTAHTI